MLKVATLDDAPEVMEILRAFFLESPYSSGKYDEDRVYELFSNMIEDKLGSVIILGIVDDKVVGILAGTSNEHLFSREIVATELAWYVYPEHRKSRVGLEMINAYEYWAKEVVKADYVTMMHLGDDRLDSLYRRRGYVEQERAYFKRIN